VIRRRTHYGHLILALAVLAVFGSLGLGRFGYSMVLPAMQNDLGLSNAQTGAMQSANLLGYLLVVAFAGAAGAQYGARRIIVAGLAVVALSMALTGLAPSYRAACGARFLTGAGAAAVNVPTLALVAAWFAARRRGLASGIAVAGSSLGLVVTGALVPALLQASASAGWRTCWLVFAGLTAAIGVLAAWRLRDRPEDLGLTPIGAPPDPERRPTVARASSLAWGAVYASPHLWHLAAVYLAFGFSYIIYSTFFVQHLVRDLALPTAAAGRLWLRIGVVSMVSGLAWGALSDRWGRRLALVLIFTVQGTAYLLVGLAGHSLTAAYGSGLLFGVTAWSIPAIMAAATGDRFGPRLGSAALGLVTVVFGVGQALAPYVSGRLADATHSFAPAFTLAGLVALGLGAGGSLLLPRVAKEQARATAARP
jgi:MFS family permease